MDIMILVVFILICALSVLVCGVEHLRLRAAQKPDAERALTTTSN